jgi:glyoxylase-like metal-dependent hydrolase (beta-lactamase superfamily II)
LEIQAFTNSLFSSVSYLFTDGNNAWIVDVGDTEPIIRTIRDNNLNLKGVFLTHCHFDHIYGLNDLVEAFPLVKVYTNSIGQEMLESDRKNLSRYHETPFVFKYPENIVLLDGITSLSPFEIHETPGHNPSCLTYVIKDAIFTGDSYIPGIAVVTNLPNSNKENAQQSVRKILELAQKKNVYPGHCIH